jgi:hypothetical protein
MNNFRWLDEDPMTKKKVTSKYKSNSNEMDLVSVILPKKRPFLLSYKYWHYWHHLCILHGKEKRMQHIHERPWEPQMLTQKLP